jgi:DNA topoisomerase 2-associated protein PAT1
MSATPISPTKQMVMVPASLHPRVEKQRRQKVHQHPHGSMPSGKTISDYALDPYAGLMSTKEREWLIKIQIIQCLGTGDQMEDDFYYTVWIL